VGAGSDSGRSVNHANYVQVETALTPVMVLLLREERMAPYSMDLRKRVLRAWDGGLDAEGIAAKCEVSRA
jgi:hypothetical protein